MKVLFVIATIFFGFLTVVAVSAAQAADGTWMNHMASWVIAVLLLGITLYAFGRIVEIRWTLKRIGILLVIFLVLILLSYWGF